MNSRASRRHRDGHRLQSLPLDSPETIGKRAVGSLLIGVAILPILAIDLYFEQATPRLLTLAVLDELAHVLTAVIVLVAASQWVNRWTVAGFLAGTVLIDIDHIPLLLSTTDFSAVEGRPATHSVFTILILLIPLLSRLIRNSTLRYIVVGLSAGVAVHLIRDLATGGVPLYWPISGATVEIEYTGYVIACMLLGLIPAFRANLGRRR
jgi:inner membrane protein